MRETCSPRTARTLTKPLLYKFFILLIDCMSAVAMRNCAVEFVAVSQFLRRFAMHFWSPGGGGNQGGRANKHSAKYINMQSAF